jgi:type IV pilus assembly protein PilW
LQDNVRFLIDDLTYQIRMAGYEGCSKTTTNSFFRSQDGANSNQFPPASDTLIIFNYGEILPLAASQIPLSNPIQLASGFTPPANGINKEIWISDCKAKPQKYRVNPVNTDNDPIILNLASNRSDSIGNFLLVNFKSTATQVFNGQIEVIYQVRTNPTLGLYRCQDNTPDGVCGPDEQEQFDMPFVEGVESMQVRYGIAPDPSTQGQQIQFRPTPMTQRNEKVVAIRINLLMRTPNQRGNLKNTTNQVFYLDGPNLIYNPQDNLDQEAGYRHRLFTTTIAVRNSIL